MNVFSITSFWQKMLKGALMIIMLLQTSCAVNAAKPGDQLQDKSSKLVSSGSGSSLTCRIDMLGEASARPEGQPIAQGNDRMGARIVLLLHNQQEMTGRLLSVRDSALVISTIEAQDNHIDTQTTGISVIKNQNIQRVIIKGKSRDLEGMALGLFIGARTGVAIGLEAGDDLPDSGSWPLVPAEAQAVIYGILGGFVGSIVGVVVGAAASKADKVIGSAMNHDFSALKPLAQFPETEPDYLRAIK